jgi:hypothetical protein
MPIFPELTDEKQIRVKDKIKEFLSISHRPTQTNTDVSSCGLRRRKGVNCFAIKTIF